VASNTSTNTRQESVHSADPMTSAADDRRARLRAAADAYVAALASKDFDAIPYDEGVVLRAPLVPGGVHTPLVGRENLRTVWWAPITPALGDVQVIDYYLNEALTGICVAAEVGLVNPPVTLRVADRFVVNDAGKIIEQENHFDPRAVTNRRAGGLRARCAWLSRRRFVGAGRPRTRSHSDLKIIRSGICHRPVTDSLP
jgi:hypothetical protein